MHFLWLLLLNYMLCKTSLADKENNDRKDVPSYLIKLQQLRRAAVEKQEQNHRQRPPSRDLNKFTMNKKKVNRYKCVLMDEDDEILINNSQNTDGSFIKIIPQDEEAKFKALNSPSFASEVKHTREDATLKSDENDRDDQYYYLASSLPTPSSPLMIKRLNNSNSLVQQEVNNNFEISDKEIQASKSSRLPIAQGIPLRNVIQTSSANISLSDNLRHIGTPAVTKSDDKIMNNNQEKTLSQQQQIQAQQQRKRYITNPTTLAPAGEQKLLLSEEHCNMIMRYASMYNVTDIKGWVHHNCAFAKMYLPNATCAEIDILVASCFD